MWLVLAFASALFAGLSSILCKVGLERVSPTLATAMRTAVVLVFAWLIVFASGAHAGLRDISAHSLVFLILSGCATGASWLFYFYALSLADVSKVVAADKSSTILTILLASLFLGERFSGLQWFGVAVLAAGTYMMVAARNGKKDPKNSPGAAGARQKCGIIAAFASAGFAALTSILGKVGIENVDSDLATAIRTGVVLVMAWGMVWIKRKSISFQRLSERDAGFIVLSGAATGASWMCFFRALQTGPASVVVPVDKLSIVVAVAFSSIFLREKLSKLSFFGLCLIVAGTLLLLVRQ